MESMEHIHIHVHVWKSPVEVGFCSGPLLAQPDNYLAQVRSGVFFLALQMPNFIFKNVYKGPFASEDRQILTATLRGPV